METEKKDIHIRNCVFIKTVLMFAIVFYHSILFWSGNWFTKNPVYSSDKLYLLSVWLNSFHVQAFTLVSGYIYRYIRYEQGKYAIFKQFVIKKIKRLIIPCIAVSVLWGIPFTVFLRNKSLSDIFFMYGLGIDPEQYWFLLMLFWVFAIVYGFSDRIENSNTFSVVFSACLWTAGIFAAHYIDNFFQIFRSLTYSIFFVLGMKIRQYQQKTATKDTIIFSAIIEIVLFIFYVLTSQTKMHFFSDVLYLLVNIAGAVTIFLFLQHIAEYIDWENNKLFGFFAENNVKIYLFHQQIIYLCITLLNGKVPVTAHIIVNFITSLLVSSGIAIILNKIRKSYTMKIH